MTTPAEHPMYRCPRCAKTVSLWEGAEQSGYYPVNDRLERTGGFESDGAYYNTTGEFGCGECSWVGSRTDFEKLGIDGKPLPFIHPNQTILTEGAPA